MPLAGEQAASRGGATSTDTAEFGLGARGTNIGANVDDNFLPISEGTKRIAVPAISVPPRVDRGRSRRSQGPSRSTSARIIPTQEIIKTTGKVDKSKSMSPIASKNFRAPKVVATAGELLDAAPAEYGKARQRVKTPECQPRVVEDNPRYLASPDPLMVQYGETNIGMAAPVIFIMDGSGKSMSSDGIDPEMMMGPEAGIMPETHPAPSKRQKQ